MSYITHPDTRVGHVHLKVADLQRALADMASGEASVVQAQATTTSVL